MKTQFQQILEDLTLEEKKALKDATAPEWQIAIRECVNDPEFWRDMFAAFVVGVAEGITQAIDDKNK